MVILGIDPGTRVTGYGVIDWSHNNPHYLASGCIRTSGTHLSERLHEIHTAIQTLTDRHRPDEAAIEQCFVHQNIRTALLIGQARGIVMALMAGATIPIAEYAPRLIKQTTVGVGQATKQQVQRAVQQVFKLSEAPPSDAADALAVALCHAQHRRASHPNLPFERWT